MQTKQKLISAAILLACGGLSSQAYAMLPSNAVLQFDKGVASSYGNVTKGSYFGMDLSSDGVIKPSERIAISQNAGLAIGKAQDASGSHLGAVDGNESPGLDNAWGFFGNTGLTYTLLPTKILSDDGAGNVTLDFSGFGVTWNSIPRIDMSKQSWQGNPEGVAEITCATDCSEGDTYTLSYSATVPAGDPSNFGGVKYNYFLTGKITVPDTPSTSSGTYSAGNTAVTSGSIDGRISMYDIVQNGGSEDTGSSFNGGLFDFTITGAGGSTQIVLPLTAPIPENAVYRKFNGTGWITFEANANNLIASAPVDGSGTCPTVGDAAYNPANGLVKGDLCVQLTIADGGPYDTNTAANDISDPGGIATVPVSAEDTRISGTDGCNMSSKNINSSQRADWWLVAGFMSLLGLFRLKRQA